MSENPRSMHGSACGWRIADSAKITDSMLNTFLNFPRVRNTES